MSPDNLLRDVFADHADRRPDAAEILAAVHRRADDRRLVTSRTLTMAGAVVAVAAVAVTGTALAEHGNGRSAPAGAGLVASSPEPVSASAPGPVTIPVAAVPTVAPATRSARPRTPSTPVATPSGPRLVQPSSEYDYSSIAAGWLPGTAHQVEADHSSSFEERDYDAVVDGVDMDVIIYLEDGTTLPTRTEAGHGDQDITINGHPAREFIADNATIVAVDLGNGKIAYAGPSVVATTAQVTTQQITDIAVHVATSMEFDRHDPIPGS